MYAFIVFLPCFGAFETSQSDVPTILGAKLRWSFWELLCDLRNLTFFTLLPWWGSLRWRGCRAEARRQRQSAACTALLWHGLGVGLQRVRLLVKRTLGTSVRTFIWLVFGVSVELLQDCFAVIAECGVFILL